MQLGVNPETGLIHLEIKGLAEPKSQEAERTARGSGRAGDRVRAGQADDVTRLAHVRSREEIKAAEEVAQRNPCIGFEEFKPIFEKVQRELETGERQTVKYKDNAEVMEGDLFILDGQKVMVADLGKRFVSDYGRPDRRLRVVYDNGTECDLLVRSLQRALNKDKVTHVHIQSAAVIVKLKSPNCRALPSWR